MQYWLMKSEPDVFSIDDLRKRPKQTEAWDGVRNYQARNFMKEMKQGDLAFFYHSNAEQIGVVGIMEITKEAYPDPTSFDSKSDHYDEKSTKENPRWFVVEVTFKEKFNRTVTLNELKEAKNLQSMRLTQKGNRLSVMPVSPQEFKIIKEMGA